MKLLTHIQRSVPVALLFTCVAVNHSAADISLPNIFNDHMVIQRQQPIRIFGMAAPGEAITVEFAGESGKAEADSDGKWRVQLPAVAADRSPREMIIRGTNTITLSDILVGDVWLCSGQSNMEWHLQNSADAETEIADANYSEIRLFDVRGHTVSRTPKNNTTGTWQRCTPKSVRGFSAVAYFFGRSLYRQTEIPVGLVGTNWGGTRIEPWIPESGFQDINELAYISDGLRQLDLRTPEGKQSTMLTSKVSTNGRATQKRKLNPEYILALHPLRRTLIPSMAQRLFTIQWSMELRPSVYEAPSGIRGSRTAKKGISIIRK